MNTEESSSVDLNKMLTDILKAWDLENISTVKKVDGNTVSTQIYKGDE